MRRFLLHILLFAAVALPGTALLVVLLGGTGRLPNVVYHLGHADHSYTRAAEAARTPDVDVLFLGSSHSYRTFDPRLFGARGIRSFNLGSSNQTPVQTEMLLHRYLDCLRPRLVVMEVHPDVMANDGVESALYLLSNLPPSWHEVPMVLQVPNAKVFCTAVYAAVRNGCGGAYRRYDEPRETEGNRYVEGGFVEREVEHYVPEVHAPLTIAPRRLQLAALRRCTALLARRGIPYVLVQVPDSRALAGAYTNLDDFRRTMSSFGGRFFDGSPALDDSLHYYDEGHLNQLGVERYCTYLCDTLIEPILNSL